MEHEGCLLSFDELAALSSLWGSQGFVCFEGEDTRQISEQQIWNACCRLMADGLLLREGEHFQMSDALYGAVIPILTAEQVLIYTPATEREAQRIYYRGEGVSVMRQTVFGRYSIQPLDGVNEDLDNILGDMCSEEGFPSWTSIQDTGMEWNTTTGHLLKEAQFLIEVMRGPQRTGWLRGIRNGTEPWVEWTEGQSIVRSPMTQAALAQGLNAIWEEETA